MASKRGGSENTSKRILEYSRGHRASGKKSVCEKEYVWRKENRRAGTVKKVKVIKSENKKSARPGRNEVRFNKNMGECEMCGGCGQDNQG